VAVQFDKAGAGFSGSAPSVLPQVQTASHTTSAGVDAGGDLWVLGYKSGADVVTNSTRTATWGGVPMVSKGIVALANNSMFLECFTILDQAQGSAQPVTFTYNNSAGVKLSIIRMESTSYLGVADFDTAIQVLTGHSASPSILVDSPDGELISIGAGVVSANVALGTGTARYSKNNVTPRFLAGDQPGAGNDTPVALDCNASDFVLAAIRAIPPGTTPPNTANASLNLGLSLRMQMVATSAQQVVVPGSPVSARLGDMMTPPRGVFPAADVVIGAVTATAPAGYTYAYDWAADAARFRIGGKLILSDHNGYQSGVNAVSGQDIETNPLTAGLTSFETEFWTRGGACAIKFRNFASSDFQVYADDMLLFSQWQNFPTSAGYKYLPISFKDGQPHRIRVLHGDNGFVGVVSPNSDDIFAAAPRFRLGVLGDSYVQGAGTASEPGHVMAGGICGHMAHRWGWEVFNLGQGTTGYKAEGVGGARSRYGSSQRLAALNAYKYDAIMVFGGGNDSSEDANDVATNYALPLWHAIKVAHPNATLIVVGVQCPNLFPASGMTALNTALRTAALASPDVDVWVDMREPTFWVTDDSKDIFITSEFPASIHPGKAGADNIVARLEYELRPIPYLGGD
jgi:hypothetical protein